MKLETYQRVNRRYFGKGSGPKKKQWQEAIERGEINGKVGMGQVWIDVDDFLSRDFFEAANDNDSEDIDLLYG